MMLLPNQKMAAKTPNVAMTIAAMVSQKAVRYVVVDLPRAFAAPPVRNR